MPITLIVCGGRTYDDRAKVFAALDALHQKRGIVEVITGGAAGVDFLADSWARSRYIPSAVFSADWAAFGRAAGPIRNRTMLDYLLTKGPAIGVVGFPGNAGTVSMLAMAREAGVTVWEPCTMGTP